MFRILSMWLKNRNNAYILNEMRKNIPHIPTYKFIPILPQLTPHLNGSEDEEFALQIAHILGRQIKTAIRNLEMILIIINWM